MHSLLVAIGHAILDSSACVQFPSRYFNFPVPIAVDGDATVRISAAILGAVLALLWTQAAAAQTLSVFGPLGSPVTYYYSPSTVYSPVVTTPTVTYYSSTAVAPVTTYYAPATSYTSYYAPAYTSYYAPAYTSYYAPTSTTSYYAAPAYTTYYSPSVSYYAPTTTYYSSSACCGY
jgi:hypothetical protein